MVTVHLDDELVKVMQTAAEPVERTARVMIVMQLYWRETISSGKAAELLGMSRLDFIRRSGELGIPYFRMTPEEWEAEMRTIDSLMRPKGRTQDG